MCNPNVLFLRAGGSLVKFLGNRIRFKREIKRDKMFVHTPRQATPTQEHLGLSKCFGICYMYMYMYMFWYMFWYPSINY